MDRRTMLTGGAAAAATTVAVMSSGTTVSAKPLVFGRMRTRPTGPPQITFTIFSRHLQWVTTEELARTDPYGTGVAVGEAALEIGFTAVDLTVRRGGHVLPEMVGTHLEPMLEGLRSTGATCDHMTTNIDTVEAEYANEVLSTASALGIVRYRWGTFRYDGGVGLAYFDELDRLAEQTKRLAKLNGRHGMQAIYHTFSGGRVGSSLWDLLYILQFRDPDKVAINFDVGHLAAEGARGSVYNNLRAAMPFVRGFGLKDVTLSQSRPGRADSTWVPAGAGIVDWEQAFGILLEGGFRGPAESQIEYDYNGVNLNQTFWADDLPLTRDEMIGTIASELATYRAAALAAGWSVNQLV